MKRIETAVGTIEIRGNGSAITCVRFVGASAVGAADKADADDARDPILERAAAELGAWFAGTLREFTVPVALESARPEGARSACDPSARSTRPEDSRPDSARSAWSATACDPSARSARATPFRLAVWNAIRSIPYGETRAYVDIARAIGKPLAARAVGQALNRNPVAIIVPCHRVVGSDGSLVGFGGGLDRKRALLELEGSSCAGTGVFAG